MAHPVSSLPAAEGAVVFGGINMDIWGRPAQSLLARDSNPGTVTMRPGGVGRNIAHDLRLLGLEVESGRFGCYRPPFSTQRWLERSAWCDAAGERWWPVLGSVYLMVAVKRVRAVRLLGGPQWKINRRRRAAAPAVVTRGRPVPRCEDR